MNRYFKNPEEVTHCLLRYVYGKNKRLTIVNYQLLIVNEMQPCHPFRLNCFVAFVNDKKMFHGFMVLFHFFSKNTNNMTKYSLTIDN